MSVLSCNLQNHQQSWLEILHQDILMDKKKKKGKIETSHSCQTEDLDSTIWAYSGISAMEMSSR